MLKILYGFVKAREGSQNKRGLGRGSSDLASSIARKVPEGREGLGLRWGRRELGFMGMFGFRAFRASSFRINRT